MGGGIHYLLPFYWDMIVIHLTEENIFKLDTQAKVNPVNCVGAMGSGLALQFKNRYPEMYPNYVQACRRQEIAPGKLHLFKVRNTLIINFPTKVHFRDNSELSYISEGLVALAKTTRKWLKSIAIPALGCGHGGLSWEEVYPLMVEHLSDLPGTEVFIVKPQ